LIFFPSVNSLLFGDVLHQAIVLVFKVQEKPCRNILNCIEFLGLRKHMWYIGCA